MGSKRYDKRVARYVFNRFAASGAFPIAAILTTPLLTNYLLTVVQSPLLRAILDEVGQSTVAYSIYSSLGALSVFLAWRKVSSVPNRYVSGIFASMEGDCTVKYYNIERQGLKFTAQPSYATFLYNGNIFVEGKLK